MTIPKIVDKPYPSIYVRDLVLFSLDDLIEWAALEDRSVEWGAGVAFTVSGLDEDVKSIQEVKMPVIAQIIFAVMPNYQKVVSTNENVKVRVFNVENSTFFSKVAAWIKHHELYQLGVQKRAGA